MIKLTGHKFTKSEKKEIRLGTPLELEHTKSRKVAERIAKQHVIEFPHYYSKGLIPLEKKLKREGK